MIFSPKGSEIVQKYGVWYMTPDGVYIRMSGISKAPHQLPHFVQDKLLLQELSYQTHIHGVASSLYKEKNGLWHPFPLSMGICKIENLKQAKEEVNILSSFKFKEVIF
jgi:hypothetical protein